jgi:4-amino-4-deoxy-L-arabinose transferase-like glycosyltransferase
MARPFQIALLLLLILVLLGSGIQKSGLASVYSDPVSEARSQDETTYASAAVGLATPAAETAGATTEWLSPKVLGRFYLEKPPLLIWLAGLSMRTLGISLFALRLPALLAGALATLVLFLWAQRSHSPWIAASVALLALANPLWHTFSRICYTDMLLTLAMIGGLLVFDRDWSLSERRSILLLGGCLAFGVMAKNVAGLLPLAVIVLACLLARKRLPLGNLLKAGLVTIVLVAPWHLYQLFSHARWFLTDYLKIQLLQFGLEPPVQPWADDTVWYYAKRLPLTDPFLVALAFLALPQLARAVRAAKSDAALQTSWLLITGGALLAFRYRNLPYLLYAIPPLCLLAGSGLARLPRPQLAVAALAAIFAIKAAAASQPWGLPFGAAAPIRAATWLHWYAEQQRPNELIAVNTDDEYYATVLPIAKIRYCYLDPTQLVRRYSPHYAFLGITVTANQFQDLDRWQPEFRERLLSWGLDSTAPVATNIVASSVDEIVRLVATHPRDDFYLPVNIRDRLTEEATARRRMVLLSRDRCFLLAEDAAENRVDPPAWRLPEKW